MQKKRIISLLLILTTIFSILCLNAQALTFDGASGGGSSGGSVSANGGYAVDYTDNTAVGYRFSLIDESGEVQGDAIDVYRKSTGSEYISLNKFKSKYNKYELISCYNKTKFTTTSGNTSTDLNFFDESLGIELPSKTSGMESWQGKTYNLNPILKKINDLEIQNLTYGDKLLIEPIFNIKIDNKACVLTVAEIAIVGGVKFGFNTVPTSSNTQGSWGFIAKCTNRIYPNSLYTPNGQGLWDGVSAATSNISFKNIITKGYGVAIAYTATANCKVKVTFDANGGSVFGSTSPTTKTYDINTKITLPTPTRSGYKFLGWYSAKSGGTKYGNAGAQYTVSSNVTMYAHWEEDKKFVLKYNANADMDNAVSSGDTSGVSGSMADTTVTYGVSTKLRKNAFSRSGYEFVGWVAFRDYDNKYFGYNNTDTLGWYAKSEITEFEIYDDEQSVSKTAPSGTVYMFAQWNSTAVQIRFMNNYDDDYIYTMQEMLKSKNTMPVINTEFGETVTLSANKFVRAGYTFKGWRAWINVDGGKWYYKVSDKTINFFPADDNKEYYVLADNSDFKIRIATDFIYLFAVWEKGSSDVPNTTVKPTTTSAPTTAKPTTTKAPTTTVKPTTAPTTTVTPTTTNPPKLDTELEIYANDIYGEIKQGYNCAVSAVVVNNGVNDVTPDYLATVKLTCINNDGVFSTQTKGVICPKINIQLVWFDVAVPLCDDTDIKFKFEVIPNENMTDINLDNNISERESIATKYRITNTKIPEFEKKATNGFNKNLNSAGNTFDTFYWEYWIWKDNAFQIESKSISSMGEHSIILTPADSAVWKEATDDGYKTRSGYGIEISAAFEMPENLKIGQLRIDVLWPENNYNYGDEINSSMTIHKLTARDYTAELPFYVDDEAKYGNAHYTPMWYPNKDYIPDFRGCGLWTPVGEMTFTASPTNTLTIEGSVWDDYYSTYYGNVKE